ncbi:hypothetical protein MVLG_00885 [Microbotryum lychnidis-dioicae p1A1 Lamole]|uniref:Uncharacterized protein n=1 Tax=Microbotryum lychnidis-dioicae (strain p1A1 Lamole / MvSl-1064) TaxID=683840 RepID=U5H0F1_USTV1|nr:hypothetical protein MVLG_00885 [Microbotryum lychnidis-dioicae p1A1 Lamole]|eukprot:KDE08778.1 hypothetical protein MVLG_00885 [Microbotryum lychnidis-dioicae p1A1 Lamole]
MRFSLAFFAVPFLVGQVVASVSDWSAKNGSFKCTSNEAGKGGKCMVCVHSNLDIFNTSLSQACGNCGEFCTSNVHA